MGYFSKFVGVCAAVTLLSVAVGGSSITLAPPPMGLVVIFVVGGDLKKKTRKITR